MSARMTQEYVEVLGTGTSKARMTQEYMEVLNTGASKGRLTQQYLEVLAFALASARLTQLYVEALCVATNPQIYTVSLSDTLTLTDHMSALYGTISDSLTLTDSFTAETVLNLDFSDTLTLTDYTASLVFGDFSDDLDLTDDEMDGLKYRVDALSDTLTLTESLLQEAIRVRSIGDNVDFDQTLRANLVRLLELSDTVSLVDTLDGVAAKVLGDDLVFADAMEAYVGKVFSDFVEFGTTFVPQGVFKRSATDQVVLYGGVTIQLYSNIEATDSVNLNDTMSGSRTTIIPTDHVVFDDVIAGVATTPISDVVVTTDSFSFHKAIHLPIGDILTTHEVISAKLVLKRQISDVISFIDHVHGIRARFGVMTDDITFSEHLFRAAIPASMDDTLEFDDEMSVIKDGIRPLNDALALDDAMTEQAVLTPGWTDELLFSQGFIVRTTSKVADNFHVVPNPPFADVPGTPPVTDDENVFIPSPVWEGIISIRPRTVLQGLTRSIILPAPEFNDFVAGQGKLAVQRSMTGKYRAYAKRTEREKLNLRFIIPKFKADELRDFLLAEVDNNINMIDYQGYLWNVKLLSDSISFVESKRWADCGNANDVTLEFVGTRYA